MRNFLRIIVFVLLDLWGSFANGQETLRYPDDEASKLAVNRASDWLVGHVRTGKITREGREHLISVVAWKDPTLNPELPKQLAGYAITDTLWASYALTLTNPDVAKALHDSLEKLDCLGNSLHEVIWQRTESIAHKPTDPDIVHGKSIGIILSGEETIDIRSFTVTIDRDFEVGHPLLFAEHAAYQSLYEYRLGNEESARNRLRRIFQSKTASSDTAPSSDQHISWDPKYGLLVDYVIEPEYSKFQKRELSTCRQYSFKLAVLLCACELLGLKSEFPTEISLMHQRLAAAQLPSGGVAHFYDIESSTKRTLLCPEATGEATAIFILAKTLVCQ